MVRCDRKVVVTVGVEIGGGHRAPGRERFGVGCGDRLEERRRVSDVRDVDASGRTAGDREVGDGVEVEVADRDAVAE